jgi:hypothetical protein
MYIEPYHILTLTAQDLEEYKPVKWASGLSSSVRNSLLEVELQSALNFGEGGVLGFVACY